jgi:molybdopterin molybdotransferase
VGRGTRLLPGDVALAAAAGHALVEVRRAPRARIVSIGSELVLPGGRLRPGQRYSSNGSLLRAWCALFRIAQDHLDAPDDAAAIRRHLASRSGGPHVAWILVGGSGGSERDLASAALAGPDWNPVVEGVRMVPGKGARFGLLGGVPVFGTPGAPSGCEIAFLTLVLPALLAMAGREGPPFPTIHGIAAADLPPARPGWTGFHRVTARFGDDGRVTVHPVAARGALRAIARTEGLVAVPEGCPGYKAGTPVPVTWLRSW